MSSTLKIRTKAQKIHFAFKTQLSTRQMLAKFN